MRINYNRSYTPPAPTIEITLGIPEESLTVGPLSAFIDTGADATIVPYRYIRPLQIQVDNRKLMRSPWGESRVVDIYFLDVGVQDFRLPFIDIVADNQGDEVILVRNILNKLHIWLNGPAQWLELVG